MKSRSRSILYHSRCRLLLPRRRRKRTMQQWHLSSNAGKASLALHNVFEDNGVNGPCFLQMTPIAV